MTHDECLGVNPTPCFGPVGCGGPLVPLWSRDDGGVAVELHVCGRCGGHVVVEVVARRVRNDYLPVPALAEARDLPGVLRAMQTAARPAAAVGAV